SFCLASCTELLAHTVPAGKEHVYSDTSPMWAGEGSLDYFAADFRFVQRAIALNCTDAVASGVPLDGSGIDRHSPNRLLVRVASGGLVKISLFYELQLPRPWDANAEQRLYEDSLAELELADELGFHTVWLTEHHFQEEKCHLSCPEVLLAALTQRTR